MSFFDGAFGGVAAAGSSLLNTALGFVAQNHQNKVNAREAQKQRDFTAEQNQMSRDWQSHENDTNRNWQSSESARAREWERQMYEQYNSPSAMMRQYREAGLNPFLASGGNLGQGIGMNAPMSGSPAAGSPSSMGSGASAAVGYGNPAQIDFGSLAKVNAEVGSQRAKSVSDYIRAIVDMYKVGGRDAAKSVADKTLPYIKDTLGLDSYFDREMESRINNLDVDSANKQFALEMDKKWSDSERAQRIAESNQIISESVAKLQVMHRMTEAEIYKIATECVVNLANAYKLRKEGDKYVADAQTINAMREHLVSVAKSDAQLRSNTVVRDNAALVRDKDLLEWYGTSEAQQGSKERERITFEQNSSELLRAMDKVFGEYFKVGVIQSSSTSIGAHVGITN